MALAPTNNITTDSTDVWVSWWNNTWLPNLQAEIDGAGSGFGAGVLTLDGRIVADETDGSALQMTGSPSLAVILPDGALIVADGVLRVVDGDQTLPVPSGFTGWITPVATVNETTGVVTWTGATSATRGALGSGTAAKVISSADAVTTLDTSETESDVILTMPLLLSRQRDIMTRLTALEGGGGGSGGGASAAEHLPWQSAGTGKDARDTVTVVNEKLAAVLAAAIDAAQAGGEFESPTETDQIWNWLLANRRAWGIEAPNLLRFLPGGGAEPGLHGTDSAPSTEQFDISGTLPAVPEDRDYDSR